MLSFIVLLSIVALAAFACIAYTERMHGDGGMQDAMDALRRMHDNSAVARQQTIR